MSLRFGYGTNGFDSHRLSDALRVIADLGYDGVALTLDHHALDPFAPDLARRTTRLADDLRGLGLAVVVETGARYLLDPWRKHEPTLVSAERRDLRVDFLQRAVRVGADLGAEAVSFWSGVLPPDTSAETGWGRLLPGVEAVVGTARDAGVVCAFEPEPGMFCGRVDDVLELRRRLGDPDALAVTLDLGHTVCNEDRDVAAVVAAVGDVLANVQVDDMLPGVHEHLELGTGDLDLPAALAALETAGYRGLAAVELPRHGHAAVDVARRSLAALRAAAPVPAAAR